MTTSKSLFIKLALMMFFQYMMFAVWWVPLAAYLTKMGVGDMQKAMILSSMAFGCLASPFVGMLADRYFEGQKVLAFTNILTAVLLALSGTTSNPLTLFIILMIAMICYMPSWGLTSSIAMTHLPTEVFARVRVFGSIGWVVSGGFSLLFTKIFELKFDGTHLPFYCAAGVGALAFITNLSLPKTLPQSKGEPLSISGLFGLNALKLMKDKNFFWFIILSFFSMVPFAMYWSYCSEFLYDKGFEFISVTMNLGQLVEMLLLLTVPFIVRKYGLRVLMILGLAALIFRYLSFYLGIVSDFGLFYIAGILVHGLIYGYFYLGGQMYIDKKAPASLKSEAQGFIFLVTFGLGLILGNFVNGRIIGLFSTVSDQGKIYNWEMIWGVIIVFSVILFLLFTLLFKNEEEQKIING